MIDLGMMYMLVGMGTVFLFLSALVGATTLMSRLVMRLQPAAGASADEAEIAAIMGAIAKHRSKMH